MNKLSFSELKNSVELIPEFDQSRIFGGDGIITGGAGTASNPYVISATYFLDGHLCQIVVG